ncbi:hypothetical protein ACFCP7_14620 [Paenibacillus elgii]
MKSKFTKNTLVLSSSIIALTTALAPFQAAAATQQPSPPVSYSIPDTGSSFTLIAEKTETFDNTLVNGVVSATLSYLFTKVTKLDVVKDKAGYIIGFSALTGYINSKLSDHRLVYAKIRLGISYNSYLGYYEYVESIVQYTNSSFNTPKDVYYVQTGTKVPDDVLAQYNLRNP